jgi:heterodisulfide reductase subunit A
VKETEHDMVILSVGVLSNPDNSSLFPEEVLELDRFSFVNQNDAFASPAKTNIRGVFVAGTASGPMDIPDSILSAGAASSEAMSYLIQKT